MKNIILTLSLIICFSCTSAKAQNYKTHRVKAGQTVETIAKQYRVSINDIYKLNPDARKSLKPNAVLIIPKKGSTTDVSTTTTTNSSNQVVEKTFDRYIKHKVKRKETLYSLSKKYNVTEDEIKKHNRSLYANNLRKGDRLQIPVFKKIIKLVEVKPEVTTAKYTVQPKEGKWRIAYKYGITIAELEALNPDMTDILQPGQEINVPGLKAEEVKTVEENYSYYTVLPAEGFYRLKVKTGLEQEELEGLNPTLKETGLKEGMILKVTYTEGLDAETPSSVIDDLSNISDLSLNITDRSTKNIAVMLPFNANKINTDSIIDTKAFIKKNRAASISLDFYSGMLMAFTELEKMGVNLNVKVHDTQSRESEVSTIVRNNNFSETDVVIGPLLPKTFNNVARSLSSKSIPVVSPIVEKINVGSNVFQSRPAKNVLITKIIDYVKIDTTAQVVVIADVKRKPVSTMLKSKFPKATLVNSRLDKKTKEDAYYILEKDLVDVLKPGNNVVFLETANPGFISNAASILNGFNTDEIKVTLVTTDQNKAFEHEEVSNYHLSNLHFTYPSIRKMVSEDSDIVFVNNYKKEYGVSPNSYAVRGYDLTMDVVLRLVTSESLFSSVNETLMTSYIENKFAYKKKTFGGYYNDSVYIVRYNDLKIEEVKQ